MHLQHDEWREVLSQWNRCHGAFYQVRDADLRWNLQRQQLLSYRTVRLASVPVLFAVATSAGVAAGLTKRNLWISLWGEIPQDGETSFLRACEQLMAEEGKERLVFGGEEFHFIPGVPANEKEGQRLLRACLDHGFKTEDACDFLGSLEQSSVVQFSSQSVQRAHSDGFTMNAAKSSADYDALAAFLASEFPGRWPREFTFWRGNSEAVRASWLLLRDKEASLVGFARIALRGRFQPLDQGWSPGALRLPNLLKREAASDSCLGPLGISTSLRGRGLGNVLLGLALQELRNRNAAQICIDWANAYNYYKPLCFEMTRKYRSAWKDK